MQRSDFSYQLPEDLIAQAPLPGRSDSRLLRLDGPSGRIVDGCFTDLPDQVSEGDLLVFNDTRVIPARLFGRKETGGRIEILVERVLSDTRMLAQVRASKSPAVGSRLLVDGDATLEVAGRDGGFFLLESKEQRSVARLLSDAGHMPLPPYITREDGVEDQERYQTVYARQPGAVAAPTAGLHFDETLLECLRQRGVEFGWVTLHVGAGTFQPMRCDRIEDHDMHAEVFEVSADLCAQVEAARARGGRIVAVGTTSVRCLESAWDGRSLVPTTGETRLFIYPGYRFGVVDAMVTNFHLPESTLLMLISAFAGYEQVMAAYRHAVSQRYRFFSYGDAMWITRHDSTE